MLAYARNFWIEIPNLNFNQEETDAGIALNTKNDCVSDIQNFLVVTEDKYVMFS